MEEPGIFSALFDPIVNILSKVLGGFYFLTEQFGYGNYGLAIILLTVVIKIILYPLTVKQLNSMRAMQKIQPELKKLQEKYKDKPQIMQQKLMQLYQKEGVNPMADSWRCITRFIISIMEQLSRHFYGCRVYRKQIRCISCRYYPR